MMSLFNSLSGGDWNELVEPLAAFTDWSRIMFASFVFFMQIGIINVLIGMYCEKASAAVGTDRSLRVFAEKSASGAFMHEMRHIFNEMDADKSGYVQWEEFEKFIKAEETSCYLRSHGIHTHDAQQVFDIL